MINPSTGTKPSIHKLFDKYNNVLANELTVSMAKIKETQETDSSDSEDETQGATANTINHSGIY